MENMKFKGGDKVRIKSLDWYNENKDEDGNIDINHDFTFYADRSRYCGKVFTIVEVFDNCYAVKEDNNEYYWSDEMIEGLVEEETKPKYEDEVNGEYYSTPKYLVRPNGYQFVDENGNVINAMKIVLEKKKPRYPKTYEECCNVLSLSEDGRLYTKGYKASLIQNFQKLLIARDAYWKIAGEVMGLGKPWEPDWKNSEERRYSIVNIEGDINLPEKTLTKWILKVTNKILVFPTEEMRDAFYENFKELIEQCKELL